ncbi:Tryptophan 2-monooxygenase [Caldisalinibacter kiritimatiensis]|uniref:Tryptophan 2-monooxygenase n=1 Tax=Caldisalinibacter kiritimatiensis TaxID=1304284 RepID=R1CHR7_9FIRM|nr:FAD-dependent oxidoreductase [Caldisalinibacter kiritimatiensis]EOD01835.1 Tryptophan 2-monooxygenase [Caldisalinibacter kiritimatiensis]
MFNGDGPSYVPSEPGLPPVQPPNPTDEQRYALIKYELARANRLEDFNNIIELLDAPPDITTIASPGEFKNVKVAVIGGGEAGLTAAFELRKLGFDITVFEAEENRIGGRVYTYYFDKEKKYYGELGAMRIPVVHGATWHYINLFNLNTRPFVQYNENAYIYVKGIRVRNDPEGKGVMEKIYPEFDLTLWERNTPWPELLNYALETPLLSMPPSIRKEILKMLLKYSYPINYWDFYNIRQVLELMGLSQAAIDLISCISPFVASFYYYSFMEMLHESYPLVFSFLYEIVGGMVNLPLSFYNSLINPNPKEYPDIPNELLGKVTWKGGTWVDGMYQTEDSSKVTLKYKNKRMSTYVYENFDYVVCAIPFSTLRNVEIIPDFSNRKMQAIRELDYSPSQKTIALCSERFWEMGRPNERIIGGGSYSDLPITSIWYPSDHAHNNSFSPNEPGVLLASYNFTLNATRVANAYKGIRFENIKEQVAKVHGISLEYLNSIIKDHVTFSWNEYPWTLGAFCYFRPEQKRIFSYAVTLPEYNNRVFFAGEHISASHGWQNAAIQTGMIAANDLAKVCKARKG